MELSVLLWISSFLLLTLLTTLVWVAVMSANKVERLETELASQTRRYREQLEQDRERHLSLTEQLLTLQSQSSQKTSTELIDLARNAQALVAAADVISFQQISVMSNPSVYDGGQEYDPSENGEVERIRLRSERLAADDPEKESLSGYEEQIANDYGFGREFVYSV